MNFNKKSEKYLEAREKLPEELRGIYDQMIEEHSFHAAKLYRKGWVAYGVLARLVNSGWKPSGKLIKLSDSFFGIQCLITIK
jgi:hypothetical protein